MRALPSLRVTTRTPAKTASPTARRLPLVSLGPSAFLPLPSKCPRAKRTWAFCNGMLTPAADQRSCAQGCGGGRSVPGADAAEARARCGRARRRPRCARSSPAFLLLRHGDASGASPPPAGHRRWRAARRLRGPGRTTRRARLLLGRSARSSRPCATPATRPAHRRPCLGGAARAAARALPRAHAHGRPRVRPRARAEARDADELPAE